MLVVPACGNQNKGQGAAEIFEAKTSAGNSLIESDKESLTNFVTDFASATSKTDSKSFRNLMDEYGVYAITYYIDKRDRNVVVHLFSKEIRSDLVLANNKKMGMSLKGAFFGLGKNVEIPIHTSQVLDKISFSVDWRKNDEEMIEKELEHIVKTCQTINLINNEYIPQIFVLKDNIFAFARSSGVLDPNPEFTGDWVIFEKVGNGYKLRAVIELQ